jgi:signal peptidase
MIGHRPVRQPGSRRGLTLVEMMLAVVLGMVLLGGVYGALTQSWRIVPVRSGSMTPTASKGSAVVAEPQRTADLRVGDIVLFHAPTAQHPLVVHRIHEIVDRDGERLYRTKGDANRVPDPWLIRMRSETVWRVHHVVPVVGNVVDAADQPYVRFGGLALAVAAIATTATTLVTRRAARPRARRTPGRVCSPASLVVRRPASIRQAVRCAASR